MEKLKVNAIKCTHCGDIIESKSRHDFVKCSCGKVYVDGGLEYQRIGFEKESDFINLAQYEEEIEEVPTLKFGTNDFYKFGEKKDSVELPDNTIQDYIDKVIKTLIEDNDLNYSFMASGDTIVFGFRTLDKEIYVEVCKNYYEGVLDLD